MKKHTVIIILSLLIITACTNQSTLSETSPTSTTGSQPEIDLVPTTEMESTPTQVESSPTIITRINIDGFEEDWADRTLDAGDEINDGEAGFLDLGRGYVLTNQDALYFYVSIEKKEQFVHFDIIFTVEGIQYLISWAPGQMMGYLHNQTLGTQIGQIPNSLFSFGEGFEGRIDFRDLGSSGEAHLLEIDVMAGDTETWRAVDFWRPEITHPVFEIDPPRMVSMEEPYVLARRWSLPEGYLGEVFDATPAPDIGYVAISESGVIYLKQGELNHGFSILDLEGEKVTRIVDLPETGSHIPFSGPGDTIFIGVGTELWQISPDGSVIVTEKPQGGWPIYYLEEDTFLGMSDDETSLLRFNPDGSREVVADGFSGINDALVDSQGRIFLSDNREGDVVRIDLDGSKTYLARGLVRNDVVDISLDHEGFVFVMTYPGGVNKLDPDTGEIMQRFGCPCGDMVITGDNQVVLANGTQSQVYLMDLEAGKTELIIPNEGLYTWAVEVGPDDRLYVGTWANGSVPGRIMRYEIDGSAEIYLDNLPGNPLDLVFDSSGSLYTATRDNDSYHLIYFSPDDEVLVEIPDVMGGVSSLAIDPISGRLLAGIWGGRIVEYNLDGIVQDYFPPLPEAVEEFYIDFGPDGTLYAYASEEARHWTGPEVKRWILKLDLDDNKYEIFAQYDRNGCCTLGNIGVDETGTIWWTIDPEFQLHRISPDGEHILFASNIPTDAVGVSADSAGNIYFSAASGILRIYPAE